MQELKLRIEYLKKDSTRDRRGVLGHSSTSLPEAVKKLEESQEAYAVYEEAYAKMQAQAASTTVYEKGDIESIRKEMRKLMQYIKFFDQDTTAPRSPEAEQKLKEYKEAYAMYERRMLKAYEDPETNAQAAGEVLIECPPPKAPRISKKERLLEKEREMAREEAWKRKYIEKRRLAKIKEDTRRLEMQREKEETQLMAKEDTRRLAEKEERQLMTKEDTRRLAKEEMRRLAKVEWNMRRLAEKVAEEERQLMAKEDTRRLAVRERQCTMVEDPLSDSNR
jgi:hypothetical protein